MFRPQEDSSSDFQVRDRRHFAEALYRYMHRTLLKGNTTICHFEGTVRRRYELPNVQALAWADIVAFDVLQEKEGETLLKIYLQLTSDQSEIGIDGNAFNHETTLSFVFDYEHPPTIKERRESMMQKQVQRSRARLYALLAAIGIGGLGLLEAYCIKTFVEPSRQRQKSVRMRQEEMDDAEKSRAVKAWTQKIPDVPEKEQTYITPQVSQDPPDLSVDPFEPSEQESHTAP